VGFPSDATKTCAPVLSSALLGPFGSGSTTALPAPAALWMLLPKRTLPNHRFNSDVIIASIHLALAYVKLFYIFIYFHIFPAFDFPPLSFVFCFQTKVLSPKKR
jgi:hypothetical protein